MLLHNFPHFYSHLNHFFIRQLTRKLLSNVIFTDRILVNEFFKRVSCNFFPIFFIYCITKKNLQSFQCFFLHVVSQYTDDSNTNTMYKVSKCMNYSDGRFLNSFVCVCGYVWSQHIHSKNVWREWEKTLCWMLHIRTFIRTHTHKQKPLLRTFNFPFHFSDNFVCVYVRMYIIHIYIHIRTTHTYIHFAA